MCVAVHFWTSTRNDKDPHTCSGGAMVLLKEVTWRGGQIWAGESRRKCGRRVTLGVCNFCTPEQADTPPLFPWTVLARELVQVQGDLFAAIGLTGRGNIFPFSSLMHIQITFFQISGVGLLSLVLLCGWVSGPKHLIYVSFYCFTLLRN